MRSLQTTSIVGVALTLLPVLVSAGGAINNQNLSSDYIRTLNRNAATDGADIIFFNPAAAVKLRPGFTIKLDGQFVVKDYGNTVVPGASLAPLGGGGKLKQDEPSFVPGLFLNYRRDPWAAFFGFSNVAGGGKVDYTRGDWTTYQGSVGVLAFLGLPPPDGPGLSYDRIVSHRLGAESTALEFRAGGAHQLSPALSVAGGLRYVDFTRKADASVHLEDSSGSVPAADVSIAFEENAGGWGAFAGLFLTPTQKLEIGFRFETEVGLQLEQKVTKSDVAVGGVSNPALGAISDGILAANEVIAGRRLAENLPALAGLGVGYTLTMRLRLEAGAVWYMNESTGLERERFRGFGESWDFGFAAEFRLDPRWKLSGGYLATRTNVEPESMLFERPELNTDSVALGLLWTPGPRLDLSAGVTRNFYDDAEFTDEAPPGGTGARVTLWKDGYVLALGLSAHF